MSEVRFIWPYAGKKVSLSGCFNNWDQIPMTKNSHGLFEVAVKLGPDTYAYKFVVDGAWLHDDAQPSEDDNYGGKNNVIEVLKGGVVASGSKGDAKNKASNTSGNAGNAGKPAASNTGKAAASNAGKAAKPAPKAATVKKEIKKVEDLPVPDYWQTRIDLWEKIKKRNQAANQPSGKPITVTLPDGSTKPGKAGITTPMDIAKSISGGLAQNALVSIVDGKPYDLDRPLEADCTVELKKFDSPEGKKVYWHSSAHIMGQALERIYHCSLCVGPPLENGGFYYDMAATDDEGNFITFDPAHSDLVKQVVDKIIKDKQPFERIVLKKEEALEMFKYNKYKVQLIQEKVPDGESCTAYRCGPLIDLCKGPHLPHTAKIKIFEVWKNSSAYWKGDSENDSLQRIYGMTFPDKELYQKWKDELEAQKKRHHVPQGHRQELFFFHDLSPGCPLILPRGARLYNKLQNFIREEYRKRGFTEVMTPNFYNSELWKISGHWEYYKDDMFVFPIEGQDFALKPMNCPGHCLMFRDFGKKSYKELPIRYADFGVLHRNELTGALSGLTRVRRFCQDDAHIFCRPDQIASEMRGCFDFLKYVYDIFGWEFTLELSTRPKKYIGDVETWNDAEKQLEECLNEFVGKSGWKINPGDGAFYGPKIDIHVFDALKREHQCATIQLDFNLPKNFGLTYISENNTEVRPVMIHRAVLGSLERFMAILVENTCHRDGWPFWLSPHPVIICTITKDQEDYANDLYKQIYAAGIDVDLDLSDHTIKKKILDAEQVGYKYILVLGQSEVEKKTVNVRRNNEQSERTLEDLLKEWSDLNKNHK